MAEALNRLLAIGFKPAGKWSLANDVLRLTLAPAVMHEQNVLYAFVVDGKLAYVGKTTQSLIKRMQGYRSPASTAERGGSTNIKNNRNIITALSSGAAVDIYALHALPSQAHGEFSVNLSAGLEDSLINALTPPWNGKGPHVNTRSSAHLPTPPPNVASSVQAVLPSALPPNATLSQLRRVDSAGVPSADDLFGFCKTLRGETLRTMVRKTQFRIEVIDSCLEITPASSGGARRESKAAVSGLLARFDKTRSFQMSDYQDVSFNASYVLALVKAWQSQSHAHATAPRGLS
jgi:hypothetical protein